MIAGTLFTAVTELTVKDNALLVMLVGLTQKALLVRIHLNLSPVATGV